MYRNYDPLYNALNSQKRNTFTIPIAGKSSFTTKIDIENLGLTYSQRFLAFFLCIIFGSLFFLYSLMNLFMITFKPYKFAIPYALSNLSFFISIGFVKGFRTYFKDLNTPNKRIYTYSFLITTFFTLYMASKIFYIFSLLLVLVQIITFATFVISFIPGGAGGMSSMIKMFLTK